MNNEFDTVVGLEVHVELSTETKMYCSCKNTFGERANTRICPICAGYPGTLPFINKRAVELAVRAGLAFNCKINRFLRAARKNYFYPDLPKGYQISQLDFPLCENGYFEVNKRKYPISDIHIEEDAGRLFDGGIDYNRCGIPLIEIVTEPCFHSAEEASDFLKELRLALIHLGVSDCKIERGSMRCDVNVSVRRKNAPLGERCELKNVVGFNNIFQGILYEEKRQRDIISCGGKIYRETRRWDSAEMKSVLLRNKENTADYRYLSEPDLPAVSLREEFIRGIGESLRLTPLPEEKRSRYVSLGISRQTAEDIVNDIKKDGLLRECLGLDICSPKTAALLINGAAAAFLRERPDLTEAERGRLCASICQIGALRERGVISSSAVKILLDEGIKSGKDIHLLVKELKLEQNSDYDGAKELVRKVLSDNRKNVEAYKKGKTNVLAFLVGQCMKLSGGKTDPALCKRIILEETERIEL